jgi:hypothetical protein
VTFKTRTCITLTCSVCGLPYTEDDEYGYGAVLHFDTQQEAIAEALSHGWLISTAPIVYGPRILPDFAICDTDEHQAARDLLLPTLDLSVILDGQTSIDDAGAGGVS